MIGRLKINEIWPKLSKIMLLNDLKCFLRTQRREIVFSIRQRIHTFFIRESITEQLTSSLTGLHSQALLYKVNNRFTCFESKPVKLEVSCSVIFCLMGQSRPLFIYFRLFKTQLTVNKCPIIFFR